MAIRSSEIFTFDNISSSTFGIKNVNIQSGMMEEPLVSGRTILETRTRSRDIPYFHGIQREPLQFTVTFAFENAWDSSKLREVTRWLTNPVYYKELIFSDQPDLIYFALVVDSPSLVHTGLSTGYITLTFRCNSSFGYSAFQTTTYDLTTNPTSTNKDLYNNGDLPIFPTITITKVGAGNVSITNNSNGGQVLSFTNLSAGEVVEIDENEVIETSLANTYRYDAWNGTLLELLVGKNTLNITGTCQITFKFRYILLQS